MLVPLHSGPFICFDLTFSFQSFGGWQHIAALGFGLLREVGQALSNKAHSALQRDLSLDQLLAYGIQRRCNLQARPSVQAPLSS